jgi:hypothetical protein
MSRTNRAYHERMCLKKPSELGNKREQALLRELLKDTESYPFPISLGNRSLHRAIPEAWDDKPISALGETKHLWKN